MVNPSYVSNHLGTVATICLFICVSFAVALCAKYGVRVPKHSQNPTGQIDAPKPKPSSPLEHPKRILQNISNKAKAKAMNIPWLKTKQQEDMNGERCLWKKTILMGEKCQPLQFSGAIYYDSEGNQLSEPPRSPRTTSPFHLLDLVTEGAK